MDLAQTTNIQVSAWLTGGLIKRELEEASNARATQHKAAHLEQSAARYASSIMADLLMLSGQESEDKTLQALLTASLFKWHH
ncbi:hypothetical protein [Pseudovibrio sp. Tun.PSC04-5.I4]|uniref:hypothetical protein n=1 Tax=Pseudovibrio sp. Tun.PSC04-5.I4 TaxID=1798213 RepID=UPI0013566FAD|nr:hypothetical protein [Pseudovibrio sp. Tun.PSC04-5.I4]